MSSNNDEKSVRSVAKRARLYRSEWNHCSNFFSYLWVIRLFSAFKLGCDKYCVCEGAGSSMIHFFEIDLPTVPITYAWRYTVSCKTVARKVRPLPVAKELVNSSKIMSWITLMPRRTPSCFFELHWQINWLQNMPILIGISWFDGTENMPNMWAREI